MSTKTKDAIRHRLLVSKYPRRNDAVFDDGNDHNPLILEDCPACGGSGKRCIQDSGVYALDECGACRGQGTAFDIVPHFPEDSPAIGALVDPIGWVECPGCHRRFATHDKHAWTGRRHRCGQRINLRDDGDRS